MNRRIWAVVIGVVILAAILIGVSLLVPLLGGRADVSHWGGMGPWMMGWWGSPILGGIGMFLVWALIIAGVVWLVQSLARGTGTGAPPAESPLDILKRRYASGEISREQFEQMKRDLGL